METFPVINSTLSADAIALFVQSEYALSGNTSCKLLKTGVNHSYLVNDGGQKCVFRIYSYNWRTRQEISEEIRLLQALQQDGIPASYPVANARGGYILELNAPEGMRYGVMFSFAEGDKFLNFPAEVHYKVGVAMARIHQRTQNLQLQRVTYTPDVLLKDSMVHLRQFLPTELEEMEWMLSAQKYLLNEMENADTTQLRTGAVHMDIWFDNMNITKEGNITLFDFDFCGNGWLCLDIAYYILQLHSTEKAENERNLKLKSFMNGYESVTPVSDEEKRLLPALGVSMYFFYLGVQAQRFDNWSNVFLNETYLKRFISLLVRKYFEENVTATAL